MQPRSIARQIMLPLIRNNNTPAGHITVIVLDMSGSMNGNDQQAVRCSAAEAFIDLSGSGDQVGIVSLSSAGPMVWHEPGPTDVASQRDELKQAIEQRPADTPDCQHPFGNTPTYGALMQAFHMLEGATQGGDITASVILLSDGVPTPDTDQQVLRIQKEVIPQFEQHHWPIDTVALGTGDTLRPFLKELARDTGGIPYDDAEGTVSGQASALNITPFFVNIFSQRVGRTLNTFIPLSELNQGAQAYNFILDDYTKELDIIVVKDNDIQATLISPGPNPIILPSYPPPPNTFVSNNSSYAVFTVKGPIAGQWQLNISGSGRYQVSSLINSWLQVAFSNPQHNGALLDLDRPFPLVTTIVDIRRPDVALSLQGLNFSGTITYTGTPPAGAIPYTDLYHLQNSAQKGFYQATIYFPPNAAPGTYTLVVSVESKTSAVISENTLTILVEHFPVLSFTSTRSTQVRWPEWLQSIYGPSDPILRRLSSFVLQGTSSQVSGSIENMGATSAQVKKALLLIKNGANRALGVSNEAHERFQIQLPSLPDGAYTVNLLLAGSFDKFSSNLDLETMQLTIQLKTEEPSFFMYLLAIGIIVAFLIVFILFLYLVARGYWNLSGPTPFGECALEGQSHHYYFNKAKLSPHSLVVRRIVYSEKVPRQPAQGKERLQSGLVFRFYHDGSIKVRKRRRKKNNWRGINQAKPHIKLSRWRYRKFDQLIYVSRVGQASTSSVYTIKP
jgi:hypothetical protein